MKDLRFIAMLLIAFVLSGCSSSVNDMFTEDDTLIMVASENGKYGFINDQAEYIIEPSYKRAFQFTEGMASVAVGNEYETKYGYIDLKGEMIIDPIYDFAFPFSEGYAVVVIDNDGYDYYGLINRQGDMIIEPMRGLMTSMYEGTMLMGQSGNDRLDILNSDLDIVGQIDTRSVKTGSIDLTGYDGTDILPGEEVHFPAKLGHYEGTFVDHNGEFLMGVVDQPIGFFSTSKGERALAIIDGNKYLINSTGDIEYELDFANHITFKGYDEDTFIFNDQESISSYLIDVNGKYNDFKVLYNGEYRPSVMVENISEGIIGFRSFIDSKCGYADIDGKEIISPKFDEVSEFSDGYAVIEIAGAYGLINRNGEYVLNPVYEDLYDPVKMSDASRINEFPKVEVSKNEFKVNNTVASVSERENNLEKGSESFDTTEKDVTADKDIDKKNEELNNTRLILDKAYRMRSNQRIDGLNNEYIPVIVFKDDYTFEFFVNMYFGVGDFVGDYEIKDNLIKCSITDRNIMGGSGDEVDYFELVISEYYDELVYYGDTIGVNELGDVFDLVNE